LGWRNPELREPARVRFPKASRGLRAWHAPKETHETGEALRAPAALIARAKRERQLNDKKSGLKANRESDSPIVVSRNPADAGLKLVKERTRKRSLHREPEP